MKNPFDFFEEIWCINLDSRTDRWEHAIKEFESVGILNRVQRFSAIKHENGIIGLIYSYTKLFEYAQQKNLENILIFEDDVKFINNPIENLKLALEQVQSMDWAMLYFGAKLHKKIQKITQNLFSLKSAYCSHAIAYHKSIYDTILNKCKINHEIKNVDDVYDMYLYNLQELHACYIINPMIALQYDNYSNLANVYAKNEDKWDHLFRRFTM